MSNITELLIRLGKRFSFLGSQYKVVVGGDEFFVDMLFFNTKLNSHIVFDLKAGKFNPVDSGELNFYTILIDKGTE